LSLIYFGPPFSGPAFSVNPLQLAQSRVCVNDERFVVRYHLGYSSLSCVFTLAGCHFPTSAKTNSGVVS